MKVLTDQTMQMYFADAAKAASPIDVWIDHPKAEFQYQSGVCYQANADHLVMGPEGSPVRVRIPYHAIRWFRGQQ